MPSKKLKSNSNLSPLFIKIGNSEFSYWSRDGLTGSFSKVSKWPSKFSRAMRTADALIVASVVPALTKKLQNSKKSRRMIELKTSGLRFDGFAYTKTLGIDRALNILAGSRVLGESNFIVIDFGTATTVDFVVKDKHLGGWILPGHQLALNALHQSTGLLPKLKWKKTTDKWGQDTVSSLLVGSNQNSLALIERSKVIMESCVKRSSSKHANFVVILTGGFSKLLNVPGALCYPQLYRMAMEAVWMEDKNASPKFH